MFEVHYSGEGGDKKEEVEKSFRMFNLPKRIEERRNKLFKSRYVENKWQLIFTFLQFF